MLTSDLFLFSGQSFGSHHPDVGYAHLLCTASFHSLSISDTRGAFCNARFSVAVDSMCACMARLGVDDRLRLTLDPSADGIHSLV